MHFTTLFVLKGAKLEDLSIYDIEDIYGDRYCYSCGESRPRYRYWCDWFQIGGRWGDLFKATKGIRGERSFLNANDPIEKDHYAIVEIKDLLEPIDKNNIYSIATKSRIYQKSNEWTGGSPNEDKFDELLDKINNKKINGVIVIIDNHD